MQFTHPLARDARVYSTGGVQGEPVSILVIVTRLVLDQQSDKYKPKQIERLSAAARAWIEQSSSGATDFLLINRPKKWIGEAD